MDARPGARVNLVTEINVQDDLVSNLPRILLRGEYLRASIIIVGN